MLLEFDIGESIELSFLDCGESNKVLRKQPRLGADSIVFVVICGAVDTTTSSSVYQKGSKIFFAPYSSD